MSSDLGINDIEIGAFRIGEKHKPLIVAEMSGNHQQSLDKALAIVDAVAEAGADALKIQTYTADTMTIPGSCTIDDPNSLWKGKDLYQLYQEAHTPWEWHTPIFKRAKDRGLLAFSTPFDASAVDFLEELNVLVYKIASFENTDLPLLQKVGTTKKPVILSTGAATLNEIEEAVDTLRTSGCEELVLLKCTSTYPASPENSNVSTIPYLREQFKCQVGLSDHTLGIGAAIAAIAFGARLIEKHITLDRTQGGVDAAFSLEPQELKWLVEESKKAFLSIGEVQLGIQEIEKQNLKFKRSIYVVKDIAQGEELTRDNIRIIRPSDGLAPKYFNTVLGKKINKPLKAGTPLAHDTLS